MTALGGAVAWGVISQGAAIGAMAGAVLGLRLRPRRPLIACNLALAIVGVPLALLAAHAPAMLLVLAVPEVRRLTHAPRTRVEEKAAAYGA